jgi:hypothetical protein
VKQTKRERGCRVKTDAGTSVAVLKDKELTFVYKANIFNM